MMIVGTNEKKRKEKKRKEKKERKSCAVSSMSSLGKVWCYEIKRG